VSGAASASFVYNGDGQRVLSTAAGATVVYVGNYLEYDVSSGEMTTYYYAGAVRIAMRVGTNEPLWLLGDHLGSTSVAANTDGSLHSRQAYTAWGATRYSSGGPPTDFDFTGQRLEAGIGLHDYGARWYDSYLNRFTQPDSIIPDPYNVLDWDRYQYVRSNPVH